MWMSLRRPWNYTYKKNTNTIFLFNEMYKGTMKTAVVYSSTDIVVKATKINEKKILKT